MSAATLGRFIRQLKECTSGVAFMEFALALPVMMMTVLGGLEMVSLTMANQQVSRIATSTADLAARYRSSIDETDIKTLMLGARLSATAVDIQNRGRIIISSVTRNANDTGHWIRWQRCEGALTNEDSRIGTQGDGQNDNSIADLEGLTIVSPTNVMYAEVVYQYEPEFIPSDSRLLKQISPIFGPRVIRYTSSFIARELALTNITNTTSVPNNQIGFC